MGSPSTVRVITSSSAPSPWLKALARHATRMALACGFLSPRGWSSVPQSLKGSRVKNDCSTLSDFPVVLGDGYVRGGSGVVGCAVSLPLVQPAKSIPARAVPVSTRRTSTPIARPLDVRPVALVPPAVARRPQHLAGRAMRESCSVTATATSSLKSMPVLQRRAAGHASDNYPPTFCESTTSP